MTDPIAYMMAYQAQEEADRLRESLISVIQAVAAVGEAVEEIQDALSASELRQFVKPESKERIGDANRKLVEALKGLMGERIDQERAEDNGKH